MSYSQQWHVRLMILIEFCCNVKAKLRMVAAERDFVVREMRDMAEQCQSVAEEFQSMADYSEKLVKEINKVEYIVCFVLLVIGSY